MLKVENEPAKQHRPAPDQQQRWHNPSTSKPTE
jgi:hypothetical protein